MKMEKHSNEKFQETYYTETLANGLKVIIWHKQDYANSIFCFASSFGALNLQMEVDGKRSVFHSGVAHFLEHKMFESSDHHDVMDDFTRLGCNVNAFTSHNETVYYFSTAKKDIKVPLELLLDFVQDFSVSEEAVEKEKGIILQEYLMYQQMPDVRLEMELLKSLYQKLPLNQDISGDEENINAISKEELETAHSINYHPSNMVLMVVTAIDPQAVLQIVADNQKNKALKLLGKIEKVFEEEPKKVAREKYEFSMDLAQPKIAVGYKLQPPTGDRRSVLRFDLLARLWIQAYFTASNPDYQKWLDYKLINDSFSAEFDISDKYALLLFTCDDLGGDFVETMDAYLKELLKRPFSEAVLKQLMLFATPDVT